MKRRLQFFCQKVRTHDVTEKNRSKLEDLTYLLVRFITTIQIYLADYERFTIIQLQISVIFQ